MSLVDRSFSTAGGRSSVPASANGSTTVLSTSTAPSTAKNETSVAQTNAGVLAGRAAFALPVSPSVPSGPGLIVRTSFLDPATMRAEAASASPFGTHVLDLVLLNVSNLTSGPDHSSRQRAYAGVSRNPGGRGARREAGIGCVG